MNINLFSFYTASLLTIMVKKSVSDHILPEYYQWWFYSDAVDNGLDSCGVSAYSYINLSENPHDYYVLCVSNPGCSWNTEKANLMTASRFSTLSNEKRRAYGSLFLQAYNTDDSLSDEAKKLIWLGLSQTQTPTIKAGFLTYFSQKTNTTRNNNIQKKFQP